jgi:hypothetical protein
MVRLMGASDVPTPGAAWAGDVRSVPDPERQALLRSVFHASSLGTVAAAVSVASEDQQRVYIERRGHSWRWSLTHAGGSYPLLRISARFLRMDYQRLAIGFRTVAEGVSILSQDPGSWEPPDAWTVLEFDGPETPELVREHILKALPPARGE